MPWITNIVEVLSQSRFDSNKRNGSHFVIWTLSLFIRSLGVIQLS